MGPRPSKDGDGGDGGGGGGGGGEGDGKARGAWKDRLTDQQLSRKRAADRQLVRESRTRARETIAQLEERISLLAEQRGDELMQQVLQENASLEQERTALRQRIHTVCSALGLSREQSTGVVAELQPQSTHAGVTAPPPPAITAAPGLPTQKEPDTGVEAYADGDAEADADAQADLSSASDGKSQWPNILSCLGRTNFDSAIDTETYIEALVTWRRNADVFALASKLFNVHQSPCGLTRARLRVLAAAPGILHQVVQDLEHVQPLNWFSIKTAAAPCPSAASATIESIYLEAAICALVAISPCNFASSKARIAMFWMYYRALVALSLPTLRNFHKLPRWFPPVTSQLTEDHPCYVDFILWPGVRTLLMQQWRKYQHRNVYASFARHLEFCPPFGQSDDSILMIATDGYQLELQPHAEPWFNDLSCLRMKQGFLESFPEFTPHVHVYSYDDEMYLTALFGPDALDGQPRLLTQSPSEHSYHDPAAAVTAPLASPPRDALFNTAFAAAVAAGPMLSGELPILPFDSEAASMDGTIAATDFAGKTSEQSAPQQTIERTNPALPSVLTRNGGRDVDFDFDFSSGQDRITSFWGAPSPERPSISGDRYRLDPALMDSTPVPSWSRHHGEKLRWEDALFAQ